MSRLGTSALQGSRGCQALIGHTGFVGSNLAIQREFQVCFNSRNIEDIRERTFREIVCAGAPGVKWKANQEPATDWAAIWRLMDALRQGVSAEHFTLISTVDVYGVTEGCDETTYRAPPPLSYGAHRYALELFVAAHFPSFTIIRLPALFGPGLKKNALHDLMTARQCGDGTYQWYPVRRLAADIAACRDLMVINFTTPPIPMTAIRDRFFPKGVVAGGGAYYNLRSIYGHRLTEREVWGELCTYLAPT